MKGHVLHLLLLQRKAPGVLGGGLRCVALTRMSRRLLQRRYDMRGGGGNAALHRCEERRMFKLLKMIWRMLGRAGLNVTTNGILLFSSFVDVSRALLRGIWRSFSISSLRKRCWYPLLIKCAVSALERVLKNSSVEQILLSRKAMLNGSDCLVWDGWQDDLRRYWCLSVGLT